MISPLVHFVIMAAIFICSMRNKAGVQYLFILIIYGTAWQMSDYLSLQDTTLFLKIFFQTSISIALVHLVTNLKYTRFTALFVGLLIINIVSMFAVVMFDKFASPEWFNSAVSIFNIINIQLIYLDLLALVGVSFDLGSSKRITRKPINANLYSAASMASIRLIEKKTFNLA